MGRWGSTTRRNLQNLTPSRNEGPGGAFHMLMQAAMNHYLQPRYDWRYLVQSGGNTTPRG